MDTIDLTLSDDDQDNFFDLTKNDSEIELELETLSCPLTTVPGVSATTVKIMILSKSRTSH